MTYSEAERNFIEHVGDCYETREAVSLARISMCHVLKVERAKYLSIREEDIPEDQLKAYLNIQRELKTGKPLQYILGETEFYGLIFRVNPNVLIPRPETEELVDWALVTLREMQPESGNLKVIDIGTGSGCIPVSIKKFFPEPEIYALDISSGALETAKANARFNDTDIQFIQDDILYPQNQILMSTKFDMIISNPPYVLDSEKSQMSVNVLEYEPHTALFVSDTDPLIFYNVIADFAVKNLQDNGFLLLEINEQLGKQTADLLNDKGFKNVELRKDLRGKDRMIKASLR